MRKLRLSALFVLLASPPSMAIAQEAPPAPQAAPAYSQAQLDQMLAPIALYPDQLVSQILMASTYPLEVVEAQRWLENPQNAALTGDQLAAAMEQQPWDPSVKSLVPFPQVLKMMDSDLQWTEQMGDAFLANQAGVMDSVQRLRQEAQAAGSLKNTPQEMVSAQQGAIAIEPAQPNMVYVPYYNPQVVYGAWPYPDYEPIYFAPPPGYYYGDAIAFFGGIAIIDALWGWDRWDWYHHRIDIDDHRFSVLNHGRGPIASGVWQHDAAHRHGVPYHSTAARAQFQHLSDEARRSSRGFTPHVAQSSSTEHVERAVRPNSQVHMRTDSTPHTQAMVSHANVQTHSRPTAPLFESFSRGSDVQAHAARGAASRTPASHAAASHPAASHEAPRGGGGHGDEGKR